MAEMLALFGQLSKPHSISFILEEPEQNLFPHTQVVLFNDIIDRCNSVYPSSAFITTHSPYLLAAANILLFKGKIQESGVDLRQIEELKDFKAIIKSDEFTAYSVSGGT